MSKKISVWKSYKEEIRKNKLVFLTVIFGPLLFLLFILSSGDNNSKKLVSPMGLSTETVASCLGFILTKKNAEGALAEGHRKFAEVHQDFLNRIDTVIKKFVKEHGNNLRHEELLNLTANYPEIERDLIKGMQEGELQYKQLSSTQRGIKSLSCIYVNQ